MRVVVSLSASSGTPRTATTSWLKPTTGALGSRTCTVRAQAVANRSCAERSSSRVRVLGVSLGSVSATTTTIERPMSQPRESAWPVTRSAEPARPARASRRKSAWYLLSTAETARALVIASAATVAAPSSRCTSSSLISRSEENATRRPWSSAAGHDADDDAGGGRAAGGTRSPPARPRR